jgi:mRNA-degrading endonuclease RelE of RelBE toxin-antitoxin system/predicted GIY-YIG superfamily endonuclease
MAVPAVSQGKTSVYRIYDASQALLYIGVTATVGTRWQAHAGLQKWWPEVQHQTVTWYSTRSEALEAERLAIRAERPLHNVTHNQNRNPLTGFPGECPATGAAAGPRHWNLSQADKTPVREHAIRAVATTPVAAESIASLDKPARRRVLGVIDGLAGDPFPAGCAQVRNRSEWHVRVGKIKVIYEVRDTAVLVMGVGCRSEIYAGTPERNRT